LHLLTRRAAVKAYQFVDQNHAERFGVEPVFDARRLDRLLELCCGAPDRRILEEESRRELRGVFIELGLQLRRIEVEIRHARQRARIVPFAVLVTGRCESELVRDVAQCRTGQALDIGLALAATPCSYAASKCIGERKL